MSAFTKHSAISPDKEKKQWINRQQFGFWENEDKTGDYIVVPANFKFDWASVPRLFWVLFPPVEPSTITAACLHDWLYVKKQYGLWKSDALFLKALKADWVFLLKRWAMFLWLKLWSWVVWYITGSNSSLKQYISRRKD